MNSWQSNTLPYRSGHQRSVSAVGYNEAMYPSYDKMETIQIPKDNQMLNQYCASYMDISNTGTASNDSRRQFSWRSPAANENTTTISEKSRHSSVQRPFESAFKAAISKMKESSIYRVCDVEKNDKTTSHRPSLDNDSYNRNCMTLQPKKPELDFRAPRQSTKVFRCNSMSNRTRERISSVTMNPGDYVSESESERTDISSRSLKNMASEEYKYQDHPLSNIQRSNGITNGYNDHSGSRVVIPASTSSRSKESSKSSSSVVSEAFISPTITTKAQSAYPKVNNYSMDMEESTDCEPLPSVQDIIAKVEALTYDNCNKIMSKSLVLTPDKPPLKKLQKSGSQRSFEGGSTSIQGDQSPSSGQRMSGVYKKNNSIPPKTNSINKMPVDFQKLHSAFLEQKQEIQNLKQEIEEKKAYINQLESDLRNYEPWR